MSCFTPEVACTLMPTILTTWQDLWGVFLCTPGKHQSASLLTSLSGSQGFLPPWRCGSTNAEAV